MAKGSVLYLSYDGLTDPLGQSQILPYLTGLSALGHSISIISFEKPDRFQKEKKNIHQLCDASGIQWIPLSYHKNPPVFSTLYDLFKLRCVAIRCCKTRNISIVHCRSYVASLVGLYLKKKFKLKFIFDMRGFWADERVDGNIWNLHNPFFKMIYNFFKKREKDFLSQADAIVSLTEKAKPYLADWGASLDKIIVIPTCTDLNLFNPDRISIIEKTVLKREVGFYEDDFVVCYVGSWGSWYETDEILKFFSILKTRKQNAKLLILSHDKVNLEHIDFRDEVIVKYANRAEIPLLLSISSLAVYFIKPRFSKTASSATKLGEFIAMKTPIVTNSGIGDVQEILADHEGAFVLQDFTTEWHEKAAAFVDRLQPFDTKSTLLDYFSLTRGIEAYHKLYLSVC